MCCDMAGVVNETVDRRHTSVRFDAVELGCQTVAARYVLARGGAVARPQLAVRNTHLFRFLTVSYTHLTLPTKRIV